MLKSTKKVPLFIALAITIALLFVVQPQPLMAQASTVTTNVQIPVNETVTDCKEARRPQGTVHMVVHSRRTPLRHHVVITPNYRM